LASITPDHCNVRRINHPVFEGGVTMAGDAAGAVPSWVDDFTEVVGDCFDLEHVPVAYDVWGPDDPEDQDNIDDPWMVHFYPSLSELVGGPRDGSLVYPGVSVDVLALQELFDDIDDLSWSSQLKNREPRYNGAVLDVLGWYEDHPVWLRVFDAPPNDAQIDTIFDHWSGRLRIKEQPPC
jgi:hypothetical protein